VEGADSRVEDTRREVEEVAEDKELCVERARSLENLRRTLLEAADAYERKWATKTRRLLEEAEMWATRARDLGSPAGEWVLGRVRKLYTAVEEWMAVEMVSDDARELAWKVFRDMLDDYCTCLEEVARARRR